MPDDANRLSTLGYDHGDVSSDGVRSYTYDGEGAGRIMTASFPGGSASYRYDPFGRRYSKTVNGVTTVYLHDDRGNEIAEFDGGSGAVLRFRLCSPLTAAPVVSLLGDGYTGEAYPALDRLGSVVSTSDGYGQYLGATSYLPYGQSSTGAPPPGSGFGFAGYRYDPETGLYYVRNRYYDPRLGRWLQPDPIGQDGGVNLYAYVGNDPLNLTDPSGLFATELASGANELIRKAGSDIGQIASDFVSDPLETARRLGPFLGGFGAVAGEVPGAIQGVVAGIRAFGSAPSPTAQTNPFGIPENFTTQPSQKGGGTTYVDPANPAYNRVRVMPGNPNSPNPAQQNPYVIDLPNGQAFDVNGNVLPTTRSPAAHIPQN